jgi:ribosomal protein S12 methylthiotransferase accessory factor
MDIHVTFPGGRRVDASFGNHVLRTDQSPEHGGEGAFPEPFDLFLASLATCAGVYVLGFCLARGISTDGIGLVQRHSFEDGTHRLARVELELSLPASFPEKYRAAVVRAAEGCKVRKVLSAPPDVHVVLRETPASGAPVARSA